MLEADARPCSRLCATSIVRITPSVHVNGHTSGYGVQHVQVSSKRAADRQFGIGDLSVMGAASAQEPGVQPPVAPVTPPPASPPPSATPAPAPASPPRPQRLPRPASGGGGPGHLACSSGNRNSAKASSAARRDDPTRRGPTVHCRAGRRSAKRAPDSNAGSDRRAGRHRAKDAGDPAQRDTRSAARGHSAEHRRGGDHKDPAGYRKSAAGQQCADHRYVVCSIPASIQDSTSSGDFHVRNEHANVQFRINGTVASRRRGRLSRRSWMPALSRA